MTWLGRGPRGVGSPDSTAAPALLEAKAQREDGEGLKHADPAVDRVADERLRMAASRPSTNGTITAAASSHGLIKTRIAWTCCLLRIFIRR